MSQHLINYILKFIKNNSSYNDNELLKIEYGIEGIILTITKIIIILFVGLLFGYFSTLILTLIFFNILRFFVFGLHAKESWQCLIISLIQFNLLPYIFLHINISIKFFFIIIISSFVSFLLFAPSDTEKRPLTNKKKRRIRKLLSLVVCILFSFIAYKISYFRIPILCSLIIAIFVINPLSYKLLGLRYNNYKKLA